MNLYVDIAKKTLASTNILPPDDENLIINVPSGTLVGVINPLGTQTTQIAFRARQDKRPDIIYSDAPPEACRHIKGQCVRVNNSPSGLMPDYIYPGQKYPGILWSKVGYLIIFNIIRNPHGIHELIGDKFTGVFILTLT